MQEKSQRLAKAMMMVKPEDADGHKQIYSYAVEHTDPQGVPDITALAYGARRILHPAMHWPSTPALLDVFALAEVVRQQVVADAREALVWDRFYQAAGTQEPEAPEVDGRPLEEEERRTLKTIAKKSTSEIHRETYRTVIMQVCWAHIHKIRRSHKTYLLPLTFRQYFPAIENIEDGGDATMAEPREERPLWLRGMSDSERTAYAATRAKVIEFLQGAELWEEEYLRNVQPVGRKSGDFRLSSHYQTEFRNNFPLIVEWDTLGGILQRHLTKIQSMVTRLHAIFRDNELPSDAEMDIDGDGDESLPYPVWKRQEIGSQSLTQMHLDPPARGGESKTSQPAEGAEKENGSENKDKDDSQESSSKLSYVDVPENVLFAPPTWLLRGVGNT